MARKPPEDIRVRARIARDRKNKNYQGMAPGGVSVMARTAKHGSLWIGAAGGGYKDSKPATPAENKTWLKKARKRGTLPSIKKPMGSKKGATVGVAGLYSRRGRGKK